MTYNHYNTKNLYLCSRKSSNIPKNMNIKERYQKFRQWQLTPFHYKNNNPTTVRCANCGTEFSDNFCPRCGQKAEIGRVGWKSVRQSVALLWGLDSRSLGFSLLQLLLRPGYMINDYIGGRRQVSFPPVKMLFIIAIAYGLLNRLFGHPVAFSTPVGFAKQFNEWIDQYPGWALLCIGFFNIFPTWLVFYHAPRNGQHSLPEGFFIQVFMATIIMLISCFWIFFSWINLLIPIYFFVAYKQLFGYGWWGTLWRSVACLYVGFVLFGLFIGIIDLFIMGHFARPKLFALILSLAVVILTSTVFINKISEKKRNAKE